MKTKPPEIDEGEISTLVIPQAVPIDARREARRLYFKGYDCEQISDELGVKATTIRSWKTRDEWDKTPFIIRAEECIFTRYLRLLDAPVLKPEIKSDIDFCVRQLKEMARVRRYEEPGGHEGDLNEKVSNRNAKAKKEPKKNFISTANREKLLAEIDAVLLQYQREWVVAGIHRNRFILKSRQIGATFAFAYESLKRALETGNNQIFISASRSQANIFRNYIVDFVFMHTEIDLRGDPLILQIEGIESRPKFYFLGTNYRTAQGYSGDVYLDEVFWVYGFKQLYDVASGMATLSKFRLTLFSTPSTIHHEAYKIWNGEEWNSGRAKDQRVKIDIDGEGIKKGTLYGDGFWRQKVTIFDAIEKGNQFIDVDYLRNSKGPEVFDNLYGCGFVDDSMSSFPHRLIGPCMVDAMEVWKAKKGGLESDFNPFAINQKHLGKVWISLDPSHSAQGDPAALMIALPPSEKYRKFRAVEKIQWLGMDYQQQAEKIKELLWKYDVEEIIIDTNGVGAAVYQLVRSFFPRVQGLLFSPFVKGQMVLKAQNVMRNRRFEMDAGWTDVAAALQTIHPEITKGGTQITYKSRRSAETGHGDLAWALIMLFYLEPLEGENFKKKSKVRVL